MRSTLRLLSLALRSLMARRSRTLLTLFGIVLGVAVILAINITNLSTLDSLTSVFSQAAGSANLVVLSSTESDEGFKERIRGTILGIPGVQEAVPSLQTQAVLADRSLGERDANFFGGVDAVLVLYGIDPTLDPQVRDYEIVAGGFLPPALDVYEVVLVESFAADQGIGVGDDLGILTPKGIEIVRVAGLMSKEGAGQLNNGLFGVMPLEAAQEIFGRGGSLDQVDILVEPDWAGEEALDVLKEILQERLGAAYMVTYPATQGKRVIQMLDVYQMGLTFFSAIAIFVGAFLIYNAFTMTVVERTREIGMLRAVGMTRRQVIRQILTEASILGIAGCAMGVGVGIALSRGLIRLMEFLLAQEVREVRIPQDGLAISVVVGLAVTMVASVLPAIQAGKVSPLEALRIRGNTPEVGSVRRRWPWGLALVAVSVAVFLVPVPAAYQFWVSNICVVAMSVGVSFLVPVIILPWERVVRPLMRAVYGSEGRLGATNIQRAIHRTTLTVMALMVGIAMLYSIQALTQSFERDVQAWIDGYIGGDLYVYSSEPLRSDFGRRLEAVDGVTAVAPMRRFDVQVMAPDGREQTLAFMAVDPASYQRVTSFVFAADQGDPEQLMDQLAAGDSVFISTVVADKYDLEPGDTLQIETRRGQRAFRVAAVVVDFWDRGLVIEGSWKDMRRYFGLDDVSAFQVKVEPDYPRQDVRERIDGLYGRGRHLTIESNEAMKEEALEITSQAFSMFDVMAAIAVIVAALGVVNTLTMNVMERTQEIGMLRGVGMTRRQVSKMILAEAGMIGIIGGVLGILFGLFQSRLFVLGANRTQGYQLGHVLPVEGLVIGLLIALVVSQLAAVWPARRASTLRIIEAIQYE